MSYRCKSSLHVTLVSKDNQITFQQYDNVTLWFGAPFKLLSYKQQFAGILTLSINPQLINGLD